MRPQPVRVAIDLETTGLHPEQDAVIEIGALKFAGEQVIETFESFVATTAPIPYRVQRLTGIKPAQLRQAPKMSELAPRLRTFLGDLPLVGHSVPFDVAFLRRAGLARHNPLVDTYELATTLLPNLSSYTLGSVGAALGCSSPTYHRALADAQLSRDVFLALLARLEGLDASVLESLGQLAAPADWTPAFFVRSELRARGAARPRANGGFGGTLGDQLAAKLGMDSAALAQVVGQAESPGSQQRAVTVAAESAGDAPADWSPAQEVVASAIQNCFDSGEPLMAEIESNAESKLACLVGVARWAEARGERVLVSVATRDAMSHLATVELPRAIAIVGVEPSHLPIADADRNDAYLCLHRWHGAARDARDGVMSRDLTRGLAKLAVWAGQTQSGRRNEVAIVASDELAWERARSGEDFRDAVASCAYRRDGSCFTTRAREAASAARIVVTTHAALAAHLAGADSLLPEAQRVLVLDAHLFEEELRGAGGYTLDRQEIISLLDTLACVEPENHRAGLLHLAARRVEPQGGSREQEWFAVVHRTQECVDALFHALQQVMREAANGQDSGSTMGDAPEQTTLRVDGKTRQLRSWQQAAAVWDTLSQRCDELGNVAREAARLPAGDRGKKAGGLAADGVASELFGCARALERLCQRGAALFDPQDRENTVFWLRLPYPSGPANNTNPAWQRRDRRGGKPDWQPTSSPKRLASGSGVVASGGLSSEEVAEAAPAPVAYCAPIHVGDQVAKLWKPPSAVALTGPALAVSGDFTFLRGSLGLPEQTVTRVLGSDRQDQTLLCLPEDVPEPNVSQYQRHLDDALVALATALGGRLVALFPSHAALRSSAQNIRRLLEQRDILVMAQGQDGSVRQLWQTFRTEERVVLLGAGAFWDGAEQVERPPACVVVTRTPFPTMGDPLLAARADQWQDQQADFIVPHAALRIHQALSGLAWSHRTRNAVVLFDRRLQTRAYGPTILGSLPRCTHYQEAMDRITERVAEWVG